MHCRMLQNASECFKVLWNASKCFKLLQNASTSLNMLENASSSISSSLRLPFPPLLTLSLCLLPLRLLVPERLQLNRAFETTPQVPEAKTRVRPTCAPGLQGRGGGGRARATLALLGYRFGSSGAGGPAENAGHASRRGLKRTWYCLLQVSSRSPADPQ